LVAEPEVFLKEPNFEGIGQLKTALKPVLPECPSAYPYTFKGNG
jgi:hypothetical protein